MIVQRVKLSPQQVAFESQRSDGPLLLFSTATIGVYQLHPMLAVAGGQRRPDAEVLQGRRIDPLVVFLERCQPFGHQIGGKQLGQRRSDSFDPRPRGNEVRVGVHGEARAGKQHAFGFQILAAEARPLAQS